MTEKKMTKLTLKEIGNTFGGGTICPLDCPGKCGTVSNKNCSLGRVSL
ncbi:MAG: hypothetical protein GY757_57075 [bacterium]|nr:hypothetical protein [bacterium]